MKGGEYTRQAGAAGIGWEGTGKSEESRNLKRSLKGVRSAHSPEPDYSRPVLELEPGDRERIVRRLAFLYGEEKARACMPELERILKVYHAHKPQKRIDLERAFDPFERFSEEDVILITYGDLLRDSGTPPIATLAAFCDNYLKGRINTIHILPFFPYSSDRGFSVVDFETVDPSLGTWQDIEDLDDRYQLMFDGVINHVSAMSRWFQEFLNGNPAYEDFFIAFASPEELTPEERRMIFRPRTSDILSRFRTIHGDRYVWTTFSRDQIDLNYSNPQVLLKIIDNPPSVRPSRGRHHTPRRGHLHLVRARDLLRAPGSGARDREAPPYGPGSRRAHGGPDHRDERPAQRQHLLLRQRAGRGAHGLQLRPAAPRASHLLHRRRNRPLPVGRQPRSGLGNGDLLQLPRLPRRHRPHGAKGHSFRRGDRRRHRQGPGARRAASPTKRPRTDPRSLTRSTSPGSAPSTARTATRTSPSRSNASSPPG